MPEKNIEELTRSFTNEGCPGEAFRPLYQKLTAALQLPAGEVHCPSLPSLSHASY